MRKLTDKEFYEEFLRDVIYMCDLIYESEVTQRILSLAVVNKMRARTLMTVNIDDHRSKSDPSVSDH